MNISCQLTDQILIYEQLETQHSVHADTDRAAASIPGPSRAAQALPSFCLRRGTQRSFRSWQACTTASFGGAFFEGIRRYLLAPLILPPHNPSVFSLPRGSHLELPGGEAASGLEDLGHRRHLGSQHLHGLVLGVDRHLGQ